jgi:AcrR family transcriptional regulator
VAKGEPSGEESAPGLSRLPPGRHGLPREFVARNQRDRLAAGIISTVAEKGYHDTTISQIAAAAGVSRRTFYSYFESKEECYFATFDQIVDYLRQSAEEAAAAEVEWPRKVAARLRSTLEIFSANPQLAAFVLAVPPRAGDTVAARYRETLERGIADLTGDMPPPPEVEPPSEAVQQSLIGGVVSLIVAKVEAGEGESLPEILPDLVELFLAPFIGRSEAVRVAGETA